MTRDREQWLAHTLIELADTLSDDFDLVELLTRLVERCVDLLGAAEAGILLADETGELRVMAATSEGAHLVELLEVQSEQGPCLDAYLAAEAVTNASLDEARWPVVAPRARDQGYVRVHALPLRHAGVAIGALNIFLADGEPTSEADLDIAQSLADIATISILHHRALRHAVTIADQLQRALDSRVAVEQAKGVLAERLQLDVNTAFALLRRFSRNHNEPIAGVARRVLDGSLPAGQLLGSARSRGQRPPASRE